jgi:DHA2 family multidrug resistance protein
VGFGLLLYREMRIKNPILNFRVLRDRNLWICCVIIFCVYAILYAVSFSLPNLLQTLFTYDALAAGFVMSPSGMTAVTGMLLVGVLLGRGADARWLIPIGLLFVAIGNYSMSLMNLDITPWQATWPRMVLAGGMSFIFAPLNVAAFKYISPQLRGAAVGMLALLRNEGGSVGTSMAQTIQERREQLHTVRVNEFLDPLNPAARQWLHNAHQYFMQQTGDPVASSQMAAQALANTRDQQASSLAYFDVFWVAAVLPLALILLVFLMKPSAAEKGAHIAAE